MSSNTLAGSVTPFARATAIASSPAAFHIASRSSSLRIVPTGQRVTAVMPLNVERRMNFDQMSMLICSLRVA